MLPSIHEGVVCGYRVLRSGRQSSNRAPSWFMGDDGEAGERKADRSHHVYLVATGLRTRHLRVLWDDLGVVGSIRASDILHGHSIHTATETR